MAENIDFPSGSQTPYWDEENQIFWDFINGSWVKRLPVFEEAPTGSGDEYCRKDSAWSEIVYPVPVDDPNDGTVYGRQNNGWVAADFTAAGPAFTPVDSLLYALRGPGPTGTWELVPNDDLTANYYDKTASDARFAFSTGAGGHVHLAADISDLGEMGIEDDAPDASQYARVNGAWEAITIPAVQTQSKSITIIDPIDTDDAMVFYTPVAITLTEIKAASLGDGTTNFNIIFADTADGTGTPIVEVFDSTQVCDQSDGSNVFSPITIPAVPAGSWVYIRLVGDPVPIVSMFHLTIIYTED